MCRIFSSLAVDVNTISRISSIFFNFLNNTGGIVPGIYPRLRTSTAAFGPASRNGCLKSTVYVVGLYPLYSPPRADAYLAILAVQNVSPVAAALHLLVENVLGRLLAS
jgi:hypothetical protein